MSHITRIKTQIKNISALTLACQELGCQLLTNTPARWYNGVAECNYCIRWQETPYDVGVIQQADGTFRLEADFYRGHVSRKLGFPQGKTVEEQNLGRLLQGYSKHAVLQEATLNNMSLLSSAMQENGDLVLRLMTY